MSEPYFPRINPFLEASAFDSDAGKPMMLCQLPGTNGTVRFAMPAAYLDFAREFDGRRSVEEVLDAHVAAHPEGRPREWLARLVAESLLTKGILVHADQDAATAAVSSQPKNAFLYVKLPMIGPSVVDPVARALGFLFRRGALALGLLVFLATHVYIYGVAIRGHDVDFDKLDAVSILILMLFSTLGTLCHEFGHASAAASFGCRRITIGWGLYLIYTVLWTNVSEAWRLPRGQRAIIDIGGVYFESFFQLAMLFAYLGTLNPLYLFAYIFIDLSMARTFNPFLRMDGYWLMSDLFGIVNLRRQQTLWLEDLAARLAGGRAQATTTLSRRARWVLAIYTVLGTAFMGYVLLMIFRLVVVKIALGYPQLLSELWATATSGATVGTILRGLLEAAWRALLMFGAAVTFWSLGRSLLRMLGRLWHRAGTAREVAT